MKNTLEFLGFIKNDTLKALTLSFLLIILALVGIYVVAIYPILLLIGLYFLPTMVGWNKKNASAIFILNLFLGWTFLGWVGALVWSFTTDSKN